MPKKETNPPSNEAEEGVEFEGGEEGKSLVVDLSDVDEQGTYEVIARGLYPAVLSNLTFEFSQRSGNPMWTWDWEVEGGDNVGRHLFYHTTFNQGGLPRAKKALMRIQLQDSELPQQLSVAKFDPEKVALEGELLGARARLRVDVRPYQGRPSNSVRDVLPPHSDEEGDGSDPF